MNKVVAFIVQGVERLGIRQSLADAYKRRRFLRLALRQRQPQAAKGYIVAARGIVIVVGLYFATVGVLLISAGFISASWGSILLGVAGVAVSVLLGWAGIVRSRGNTCNPAVVFVAEFLSRICGQSNHSTSE